MNKEFDYKIKGIKRIRCPKCQKLGVYTEYKDGSGIVKHKAKINEFLGCLEITRYCFIKKVGSINNMMK